MWYFSWILGTAFAGSFAILCALWFELRHTKMDPANKSRDVGGTI